MLFRSQTSRLMEAVQGDRRTNVMQTPKITMFNGQSSILDVTEPESFVTGINVSTTSNGNPIFQPIVEEIPLGLHLTCQPVVSADNRSVKVSLHVNMDQLVLQRYISSGVRCWREIRAARLRCW